MSLGSESRENEAYEKRLVFEQKRHGHNFINLILISDRDYNFFSIGGVDILHPIEFLENNKTKFKFKKAGGSIKFRPDPMMGGYPVCELLDTPHNRKMLATHYNTGDWQIEDKDIDSQIKGAKTKIENKLKQIEEGEAVFRKEIQDLQDGIIGADDQKTKNQLTNKLVNLVSSRARKKSVVKERERIVFPERKKPPKLRNQKKEQVSELVKVDEHE